ncbi:MAG: hypothetical protein IPN66_08440 [Candidatus Competibacteraceae bacterium]|nr:hypothetical protein [Candidatus Competibacteraceae bacterium]
MKRFRLAPSGDIQQARLDMAVTNNWLSSVASTPITRARLAGSSSEGRSSINECWHLPHGAEYNCACASNKAMTSSFCWPRDNALKTRPPRRPGY